MTTMAQPDSEQDSRARATTQAQFLQVLSRDAAEAAFMQALQPRPLGVETVMLPALPGRVLAGNIRAPVDAPPYRHRRADAARGRCGGDDRAYRARGRRASPWPRRGAGHACRLRRVRHRARPDPAAQGRTIGAREVAMLAAVGLDRAEVWRRPRVAVLSTGDELVQPGQPLRPGRGLRFQRPVIAAALRENGLRGVHLGAPCRTMMRRRGGRCARGLCGA
jgi:putative molybdopterin biosynthesis protein